MPRDNTDSLGTIFCDVDDTRGRVERRRRPFYACKICCFTPTSAFPVAAEEKVPFYYEFTERPAGTFPIFRTSTAYHKKDCPIRCPFYKGDYSPAKSKTPVAADILRRIMLLGLIERPPALVKRYCNALRRIIKRMESE